MTGTWQNSSEQSSLAGRSRPALLLTMAIFTSALSSVCCLGPLLLISLGISGTWMGSLMLVQEWYPLLAGISIVLVILAGKKIMQIRACDNSDCADSLLPFSILQNVGFLTALIVTAVFLSSEYWLLWLTA
jgi:mercuric ion transport protein